MYHKMQNLDTDPKRSPPARVTRYQAPLLTKMATGLRDNRSDRRRMISEPVEVLRAKRKLMATVNQSKYNIGIRRQTPAFLQCSGSRSLQENTTTQTNRENKERKSTDECDIDSESNGAASISFVDQETDKVVHYDDTLTNKESDTEEEHVDQTQIKAVPEEKPGKFHEQVESMFGNRESLRYYEGQSVKFFPYLGPEKQKNKGTKPLKEEQPRGPEVKKINSETTDNKTTKRDKTKKEKKLFKGFPKSQWAKVYPINIPDDTLKPRTKEDLARIAAMFCVESRVLQSARSKPKPVKLPRKVYHIVDDDDDDDCFRPGVWGCEFSDANLAKADVDYHNIDLDIPEPTSDTLGVIEEKKDTAVNIHVDNNTEKNIEMKKPGNRVVRFFRRLFKIK